MTMRTAASALRKPFHPVLNALPILGLPESAFTTVSLTGSALRLNCTRNVASDTRSLTARFIAVYCSTSVSRSVS
jgi:hypothetical protein